MIADGTQSQQTSAAASAPSDSVHWSHPAGIVTDDTINEVTSKIATREWARRVYAGRKKTLDKWIEVPYERLRNVSPRKRGNVYHNFSCPRDRSRLTFDPFVSDTFKCPSCGKSYPADTDAGIYPPADAPFLAVHDAWRNTPNLKSIERSTGAEAVQILTATNTWYALLEPGKARFSDGVTLQSDAAFALLRNRDAVAFVGGTRVEIESPEGGLVARCDRRTSISAEWSAGTVTFETSDDIQYETVGGQNLYRPIVKVAVSFDGTLWKIAAQKRRVAGQIE